MMKMLWWPFNLWEHIIMCTYPIFLLAIMSVRPSEVTLQSVCMAVNRAEDSVRSDPNSERRRLRYMNKSFSETFLHDLGWDTY